jgi:hypothetical protein
MRFNEEVNKVLEEIQEMLIDKNAKYGNSALEPLGVFSQLSAKEGLLIRIDDKLKRIKNGSLQKDDEDVVNDLIGYLVLLKIHESSKYEPNEALKNAASSWREVKEKQENQEMIKNMQQDLREWAIINLKTDQFWSNED